eukprot:scaffold2279_cov116-Isochrysis_galbana.AAC.1
MDLPTLGDGNSAGGASGAGDRNSAGGGSRALLPAVGPAAAPADSPNPPVSGRPRAPTAAEAGYDDAETISDIEELSCASEGEEQADTW